MKRCTAWRRSSAALVRRGRDQSLDLGWDDELSEWGIAAEPAKPDGLVALSAPVASRWGGTKRQRREWSPNLDTNRFALGDWRG